jgi:hypothetical protein
MMRILVAGLIGGLVMFVWGAVSHMLLPIGEMGMKVPTAQASTLAALLPGTQGAGVYMYPSPPKEDWQDEAKMAAFAESTKGQPFAFVVFQPGGNPVNTSMTGNLVKQWGSDTLAAMVASWILALCAFGFGRRVMIAGALGLFAWLAISVPYWNWYMFPSDFTVGNLAEQVLGWLISGSAIAWWLGRGERR